MASFFEDVGAMFGIGPGSSDAGGLQGLWDDTFAKWPGFGRGGTDRGGFGGLYDDTIGELTGSSSAARAAKKAAQQREAELRTAVGMGKKGLGVAQEAGQRTQQGIADAIRAADSPQELAALEKAMESQEKFLQRQEQVLANIDPAVIEAAEQTLAVLRGDESQFLDPVRQERARQREDVVNMLREQMGPGAETSTAGIQALNKFDAETNMLISEQRQRGLNQLWGIANQGATSSVSAQNAAAGGLGALGQAFGDRAQRMANTRLGGLDRAISSANLEQGAFANLMNAQQGLAAGAGSNQVGNLIASQGQQSFINQGLQLAMMAMGASAGGPAGAAAAGAAGSSMGGTSYLSNNPGTFSQGANSFWGGPNPYG